MPTIRRINRLSLVVAGLLLLARAAAAQDAGFVTASGFADVKRFGTTNGPYIYDSAGGEVSLDGTAAGAGLRIGTFVIPQISLELSIDAGGRTAGSLPDLYRILAVGLPVRAPQLKESTQFLAVSTVLGFHPAARGRVRMGYLGGLAFVRGTYKSGYPSYGVPVPLFTTISSPGLVSAPLIYEPPTYIVSTFTQQDNKLGVLLGVEAAIDLGTHVSIVPEARALTFSTPNAGPRVFLIRPGVGVRWKF